MVIFCVVYGGIIYGLAAVGALAALIFFLIRGQRFRLRKDTSCLETGDKFSTLFKTPVFLISIIVFTALMGLELML